MLAGTGDRAMPYPAGTLQHPILPGPLPYSVPSTETYSIAYPHIPVPFYHNICIHTASQFSPVVGWGLDLKLCACQEFGPPEFVGQQGILQGKLCIRREEFKPKIFQASQNYCYLLLSACLRRSPEWDLCVEREGVRSHGGARGQGLEQVQLRGLSSDHSRVENLPVELPEHSTTPTVQKQYRPMLIQFYKCSTMLTCYQEQRD